MGQEPGGLWIELSYVCLVGGAGWGGEGTAPQEVRDRVAHSAPALATTVGASVMRQGLEKAVASV